LKEEVKRILICDDNVEFLRTIGEMLKFHGYDPIITKTGNQALDKARKLGPNLVLLDYRLPDTDGATVLRELRKVDHDLPIIIMTGYGDQKLAAEVIKLGAMDYLVKPFKSGELLESIQNTLRKVEEIRRKKELEKLVHWGKLFPLVAHEIRNPLHSMGGALTLIRSRLQNDETAARAVQIIHEEIVRLNEFVNQCLDFSRSPSEKGFSSIDLNDAVSSCIQLMTPFLKSEARKVKLQMILDDNLPEVFVNPDEIKRVLINLLRNAVEAIPKEGQIIVETNHRRENSEERAEVKVIDDGVGISEKDLPNLFAPFFSNKRSGIGLGLAICKKIVEENHRGQIRVESKPSEGTTVIVALPIGIRRHAAVEVS
jgi:signal transduction histidine kinase